MTFPVWCLYNYLVQEVEERVPLSKSETIFFTARFPRIRTAGYIRGINSADISGFKKYGGLRFGLAGWTHVWFTGGAHFWLGGGGGGLEVGFNGGS